jgi:hypothetical protein
MAIIASLVMLAIVWGGALDAALILGRRAPASREYQGLLSVGDVGEADVETDGLCFVCEEPSQVSTGRAAGCRNLPLQLADRG